MEIPLKPNSTRYLHKKVGLIGFVLMATVSIAWCQLLPPTPQALPIASHNKIATHQDQPQISLKYDWTTSQSAWDTLSQTTIAYFTTGDVAEEITSTYAAGQMQLLSRQTYAYDTAGRPREIITFARNAQVWDSLSRMRYTWDAFGNLLEAWEDGHSTGAWDTLSGQRNNYTYRPNHQVTTQVNFEWQAQPPAWLRLDSLVYAYDGNNAWDTVWRYVDVGNAWVPEKRWLDLQWHDFAKQLPTTGTIQVYNNGWLNATRYRNRFGIYDNATWIYDTFHSPNWDSTKKEVFVYDAAGHETAFEQYDWVGAWMQSDGALNHYTYDGSGRTTTRVHEFFDGYLYRLDFKWEFGDFVLGGPPPYLASLAAVVYPNPVADVVHFALGNGYFGPVKVEIFDTQGRLRVASLAMPGSRLISVPISDTLENGSFTYRLTTKTGQAAGRLVVHR